MEQSVSEQRNKLSWTNEFWVWSWTEGESRYYGCLMGVSSRVGAEVLRKTWGSGRGWQCRGDQRDGGCGEDRGDVVKGGGSGNDTGCRVLDLLELVGEFVRWEGDKTEIFFLSFHRYFAKWDISPLFCKAARQESSNRIYPLDHLIV